ncbi:FAD-dependent oxidoreductase [Actinokineospora spheciospongiae]|uniref:FAD-dependent oxidoreductase n=1 Tax=Actinokineospora spheciospongiae TaxID=909613 RepID=UPI000D7190D6|nr:FAD-dependent oxidoreductase [Actinokineospora spheciospongiae]PWW66685.1 2-polyprenyl-6-methoxyphenol hydroxylase-like FAD-dependent oxidoreductase [Actinokineospora spheciospongiae]
MDNTRPVVVVGGGPGGMVLGYLLARAGVRTTVLESHGDFAREFRGDSLHPYTLELFDQLGLADDLLALAHHPARSFRFHTPHGPLTVADYAKVRSRFPYVALMPQSRFLTFLAERAAELPAFDLRMHTRVTDLLRDDAGAVTGVRHRGGEVEARLVVATDGRFSAVRKLADLPAANLGATTDLLWFRLPRLPTDPPDADVDLYFGRDHYLGLLGGTDTWQVGYSLPKGGYQATRAAGLEPIRASVARQIPWLADRVPALTDFAQTTLLSVDISRVDRWHRPGLLLLGDAAHVISPVGGNGILMAVQDAVAAANRLVPALTSGTLDETVLATIQADREPAIRQVQAQQVRIEQRTARARDRGKPITPPRFLRVVTAIPGVRARAARANAYGPNPPRLTV